MSSVRFCHFGTPGGRGAAVAKTIRAMMVKRMKERIVRLGEGVADWRIGACCR